MEDRTPLLAILPPRAYPLYYFRRTDAHSCLRYDNPNGLRQIQCDHILALSEH